jgi:hypothetical protein
MASGFGDDLGFNRCGQGIFHRRFFKRTEIDTPIGGPALRASMTVSAMALT